MVFFPYFSHTGQDMMLRYMITLLLCNELLRITQHGARDHILVLLRCSLALLPRMLKVIYYMEDFHVHAVMIQQWLLLKFCNVNSAYYLSGTHKKKGRLDLTKSIRTHLLTQAVQLTSIFMAFTAMCSFHVSRTWTQRVLVPHFTGPGKIFGKCHPQINSLESTRLPA